MKHRKTLKQSLKDWWADYRAAAYISSAILGITVMAILVGQSKENRQEQINKQVETYEKTLPGYLEQKQMVEYYRDSLMRTKNH